AGRSNHDRNRLRRLLSGASGPAATRHDEVDVETGESRGGLGQGIALLVRVAVLEDDGRARRPAAIPEGMLEDVARHPARASEAMRAQDANPRSFARPLRVGGSWSEQRGARR